MERWYRDHKCILKIMQSHDCTILESIAADLNDKGYTTILCIHDQQYNPNFKLECIIYVNHNNEDIIVANIYILNEFLKVHGSGRIFGVDMIDPVSIDQLYLILELLTKIAKEDYSISQSITHAERLNREKSLSEVQAQFMREYHIKRAQLDLRHA